MDFGLNETQELIRSSAGEFLAETSTSDFVRAMADDERGYTQEFWRDIAELGWLGLMIPEEMGGAGMDMSDMAVLVTEWGASLAPGPLIESSIISATVIDQLGSDQQRQRWLPAIASGESVAVPAMFSERGYSQVDAVDLRAAQTTDGWVLNGNSGYVPYANSADLMLVPARADAGLTLFAIPTSDIRGTLISDSVRMASGSPTFNIGLNEIELPSDSVLGEVGNGNAAMTDMMLYGATARAVQMAGAGRAVLDHTLGYVKERKQFGRAIGSFQAIQHYMADMAIKVKSVKHLSDRAAWAIANETDNEIKTRLVGQAKWSANKLIPEACWTAHQTHGAIGFTWEHDLHLYTRRVLSWRAEYGDLAYHIDELAKTV